VIPKRITKRCPGTACSHAEYIDESAITMEPQPFCPACMKAMYVPAAYEDGSGDEYEEVF